MKTAYKLEHKRVINDDFNVDEVYETKLLGFFSSEEKCRKMCIRDRPTTAWASP